MIEVRARRYGTRMLAVMAATAACLGSARADPLTGGRLAEMCVHYEPRASYYILGAIDAFNVRIGQPRRFCIPKGSAIPSLHLANTVCGFISRHPEQADLPAAVLVFRSLRDAYPCGAERR